MHKFNGHQNKLFLIVFLLVTILLPGSISAQTHFTVDLRARTKPQSVNLVGSLAVDRQIWGPSERTSDNPLFGFVSVGTRFGGSPTLSGFVQIAPISPLVVEFERSMTQRFGRTVNFPCESVECKGRIDRTDISVKLAGAYRDLIFLGSYLQREVTTMISERDVMIELEDLVVSPGTHRFSEASGFFGMNLAEKNTVGIAYAGGLMGDSPRGYQTTYLIYRLRKEEYVLTLGAGNYKSDYETLNGFSAVASIARTWGQGLSLF